MGHSAQVRSVEALNQLAAAIKAWAAEATVALEDLGMDMHRAVQWVDHDQREYWAQEGRKAQQAVTEARIALERKRSMKIGDREPACDEEKKALEMAKRRLERARQKNDAVKRWIQLLEHESIECRSGIAPLAHWVETDVPRALAMLRRMSRALGDYVGSDLPAEFIAPDASLTEPLPDDRPTSAGSAAAEPPAPQNPEETNRAGM